MHCNIYLLCNRFGPLLALGRMLMKANLFVFHLNQLYPGRIKWERKEEKISQIIVESDEDQKLRELPHLLRWLINNIAVLQCCRFATTFLSGLRKPTLLAEQ